jgi:NADH-quinone oxidoreductase subunit C
MPDPTQFLRDMAGKVGPAVTKKDRLYFEVSAANLPAVARHLFQTMGCRLSTATAMEMRQGIEILYHFSHDPTGCYYCPRLVISDLDHPRAPSISGVVRGAEWIEREMSELWGVAFEGHPFPERLLTRGHPCPPDRPLRHRRPK